MTKYLLLGACLALASCAAQKALPQLSEEQKRANERGIAYWQPDSTSQADTVPHTPKWAVGVPPVQVDSLSGKLVTTDKLTDKPAGQRRLFGLLPPKKVASSPQKVASDKLSDGKLPRKCKGCTIVYGDAIVAEKKAQVAAGDGAAVVVAEKKAGPVVLADSGAEVQVATAKKGQAAAGKGISQTQPPEPSLLDKALALAVPVGVVAAIIFLTSGGPAWLFGLMRRRKADNQA